MLDYVELYLTDRIIDNIVTETHGYAECFLVNTKEKRNKSLLGRWELVTPNEIKSFLRVLLLIGII